MINRTPLDSVIILIINDRCVIEINDLFPKCFNNRQYLVSIFFHSRLVTRELPKVTLQNRSKLEQLIRRIPAIIFMVLFGLSIL